MSISPIVRSSSKFHSWKLKNASTGVLECSNSKVLQLAKATISKSNILNEMTIAHLTAKNCISNVFWKEQ